MILLDTDVMIDILRMFPPAIQWMKTLTDQEIILPGFVAMELLQGCRNKTEIGKLKKTIEGLSIMWPEPESCNRAIETFSRFHLSKGLGIIDALVPERLEVSAATDTIRPDRPLSLNVNAFVG